MLTIEELVIQSLYHKLVLVNVKRKPIQTPTGGKVDGLGLLIMGGQRMRAAMATEAGGSGGEPGPSTSGELDEDDPPGAVGAATAHGQVRVNPDLQTILDTGEFQLVRHLVQQQQQQPHPGESLSPLWFLGSAAEGSSVDSNDNNLQVTMRTSDSVVTSQPGTVANKHRGDIVSASGSSMESMDLSAYEQFSILHYMDLRDPVNRSMVMVQTPQMMGANMASLLESEERLMLEGDMCSSALGMCAMDLCSGLDSPHRNTLTIVPRPILTPDDIPTDNGHLEMSFDNEIDSGIWDMVLGRESQLSMHELCSALPDMPNGHPKSLGLMFPSNNEEDEDEMAYIPDAEPVMSYKVYQISDEVVLSSSGDELDRDSRPQIKHKVETITEKKALPLGNAGRRKVKRKTKTRPRGGSRRGQARGRRKVKTPPRTPTSLPLGARSPFGGDITSPEGYTTSGTTTSAQYHTAAENLDSDFYSPDALKEGVTLNGGMSLRLDKHRDRDFDADRTPTNDRPYRTFSPGPRSPLETTFDVDNSVTSTGNERRRIHNVPLRPGKGTRQGLNLFRSPRTPTGVPSIINRHSLQDGRLSSPMSEDTLTPSSEDSMFENFVDASTVPTLDYRSHRSARARSYSPGHTMSPKMASYRGPFLSVPTVQRGTPSDDSDQEYESAEDLSLQDSLVAVDLADLPGFVDHSNWMAELPKRLHSAPLSVLAIPGSNISLAIEHDMRTDLNFSKCNLEMAEFLRKLPPLAVFDNFRGLMKTIWRSWMAKQMLSVKQQLLAGVRYFDFRITKYRCALYGEHGLFTRQLKRYLKDIDEFLIEHPKEVIIIHFQRFENLEHRDKRALVTALFQIYGARLCRRMKVDKTSLEVMWENRRQVIVLFPDSDIEELHDHIFVGLVWSDKTIKLSLPRKQRAMDLIRYLDAIYDDQRGLDSFQVTQAVLAPDLRMVFGDYHYRSMKELCLAETCPNLKQWLLGKNDLNIIAIDYVGAYDLTGSIIALNELKKAETVV